MYICIYVTTCYSTSHVMSNFIIIVNQNSMYYVIRNNKVLSYLILSCLNHPNPNKAVENHAQPPKSVDPSFLTTGSPHMTRDRRSRNVLPNNRELGFIVITDPGDQPLSLDQSASPIRWLGGMA